MFTFTVGKPLEFDQRYREQAVARDFWRRSDRARWDYASGVDAQSNPILPKHEREPDDRYNRRKRQALVRRYARPIIDRYVDFVTRQRPTRPDGTGPYKTFLEDIDGAGTDVQPFFKRGLRSAAVDGLRYFLVDANDANVYANAQEEQTAGKRGIVRSIDPDDVVYWRDWQGKVAEAVVLCSDRDDNRFAWCVNEKTQHRVDVKYEEKQKKYIVTGIHPASPHGYGGCPLVRLKTTQDDDGTGEDSMCAPLADGQKRICNIDSWLLEELQGCTFTTSVLLGVSADSVKEAVVGPGMMLCLPSSNGGSNPSIGRLGSDVSQAGSIRDSLAYEIKELYRIAGLSSGNPTESAQPESGVAKAFAFNEIEAKCAAMADALEECENTLTKLLAKGFGWAYPGPVKYPETFDALDLANELSICQQMQLAGLPEIIKRMQVEKIAGAAFELSGDQKAALQEQLDTQSSAAEKSKNSPVINPATRTSGT